MKSRAPSCVKFMLWALSPESGEPWALGVHESCMIALCHVPSFLSLSVVYTFTRRTPYLVPLSEISGQSHMLRNGERWHVQIFQFPQLLPKGAILPICAHRLWPYSQIRRRRPLYEGRWTLNDAVKMVVAAGRWKVFQHDHRHFLRWHLFYWLALFISFVFPLCSLLVSKQLYNQV